MMQLEKQFVSALGQIEQEKTESGSVGERQRREGGKRVRERDVPAAVPVQVEVVLSRQTEE